jgi:hypothetical protein
MIKIYIFIITLFFSVSAIADTNYKDMCSHPKLPEDIKALEPKMVDYITPTPDFKDPVTTQKLSEFFADLEEHKLKYKKEYEKVTKEREEINQGYNTSQRKFYEAFPTDWKKNEQLLQEIKNACWIKTMDVDEFEKDSYCNPLEEAPSRSDWNNILTCTFEKANLLNIELYK